MSAVVVQEVHVFIHKETITSTIFTPALCHPDQGNPCRPDYLPSAVSICAKASLPKIKSPLVPREVGTKGSDEPHRPGEDKSQGSPIPKRSVFSNDTTTYSGLSVGVSAQVAYLRFAQRLVDRRKAIVAGVRHHGRELGLESASVD